LLRENGECKEEERKRERGETKNEEKLKEQIDAQDIDF